MKRPLQLAAGAMALALALTACAASTGPHAGPASDADRALLRSEAAKAEADVRARGLVYADSGLQAYLDSIAAALAAAPKPTASHYQILVLLEPAPLALPHQNGTIYLSAGALARLDDEAQLALLIARDMSHVELDHLVEEYAERRALTAGANVAGSGLAAASVATPFALPAGVIGNLALSRSIAADARKREEEADRAGMERIAQAGFATATAPRLFELMSDPNDPGAVQPLWSDRSTTDGLGRACASLVASGAVAANPSGRNDSERLRRELEGVSRESLRLEAEHGPWERAHLDAGRMISRYGESALLRYYEGESLLRLATSPKQVPLELQARGLDRHMREEADARVLAKMRAGEPGQLADAARSFRRALDLDPRLGPARRGLGEVLLHQGDSAGAKLALDEYLAENPDAPDARLVARMLAGISTSGSDSREEKP